MFEKIPSFFFIHVTKIRQITCIRLLFVDKFVRLLQAIALAIAHHTLPEMS